jgi:hypothetical protein
LGAARRILFETPTARAPHPSRRPFRPPQDEGEAFEGRRWGTSGTMSPIAGNRGHTYTMTGSCPARICNLSTVLMLQRPRKCRHGLVGERIRLFTTPGLQAHCDAPRCSEACKCLAPGSAQLETPRRDCYHVSSQGEHWRQRCRGRGRPLPDLGCYESYCQQNQLR